MAVLNELRPGLDEKPYEKTMVRDNTPLVSIVSILMNLHIRVIRAIRG